MKSIEISASTGYQVIIGEGLLSTLGAETAKLCKAEKAVIVSDSNVFPLYGQAAQCSLEDAGFSVCSFVFPAGEQSKSLATYTRLMSFLASHAITRSDCLIALGGGVVGDLTGFAAATYLRGIPYIQVPTTLLAAVDSSVGGKTAVDLPEGKNLCGAFYQPRLVLCDILTLNTLPEDIFRDGCAEVIKYGILYDPQLFGHLMQYGLQFHREDVIARCVELKRDVVAQDEFDTGARMKLNLGHTVGHGVEAQSGYQLSHGTAVAIGMAIVARAATSEGYLLPNQKDQILQILSLFGLPDRSPYPADALYQSALSDKKRSGGTVNLIIPAAIGDCRIAPTPVSKLKSFIEAGL